MLENCWKKTTLESKSKKIILMYDRLIVHSSRLTYISRERDLFEFQTKGSTHLPLTENRLKFFVPSNPTNNYENIYIWWHEIIKINLVSQALFEKTHFSVILYYKIDHFCPLNAIFTHFLPFDPMFGSGIHYYLVAIICWYK